MPGGVAPGGVKFELLGAGSDDSGFGMLDVFNWIVFSLFLEIEFMELFEVFDQ